AALRLLYYFPKEVAPLVAGRLRKLDVGRDDKEHTYTNRCVANGVEAEKFLKAVAWSEDPDVRAAVGATFKRAKDPPALLAALSAVKDAGLIRERLEPQVAKLPAEEDGPYGEGYELLLALARRTPDTTRPVFEQYLRDAGTQRCRTACEVLREVKVEWDAEVL